MNRLNEFISETQDLKELEVGHVATFKLFAAPLSRCVAPHP